MASTQSMQGHEKLKCHFYARLHHDLGLTFRLPKYGVARVASRTGLVLGSETASTVSSRGEYFFPVREGRGVTRPGSQCSSYDLECCPWSNLPDDDWAVQDDNAWTIGEFAWTGFDYLGEPTPYGAEKFWPSRSAYSGIVDLAGIPKDRYWLYRSRWRKDAPTTLHVLPHWTWPGHEGGTIPVYVYTSYESAELFVNGVSQGRRHKDAAFRLDRYRLRWNDVAYAPGELKAVAYDASGRVVAESVVRTAGKADRIELVPEAGVPRRTHHRCRDGPQCWNCTDRGSLAWTSRRFCRTGCDMIVACLNLIILP